MASLRPRVLFVTVEPLWPATHGGRVRTGKIAETLAANEFEVRVLFPRRPGNDSDSAPHAVQQVELAWSAPSNALKRLTWSPWLGVFALPRVRDLQEQVDKYLPDFIYWSHSYLAAVGSRRLETSALQIVEFANIERNRFFSISKQGIFRHRVSAFFEFLKACVWERKVARNADLCIAISPNDQETLNKLGGNTITVENALPTSQSRLSPDNAVVMSLANWNYGPNQDGISFFLETGWRAVLEAIPHARLVLVGNGSDAIAEKFDHLENITAVGFADDLTDLFADSTLFLAPARSGAGRQLKVAEALGHGRTVVGPPFLNRERRQGLPESALTGSKDVAGEIIRRIENLGERHEVERGIAEYAGKHDWQFETATLRRWMTGKGE